MENKNILTFPSQQFTLFDTGFLTFEAGDTETTRKSLRKLDAISCGADLTYEEPGLTREDLLADMVELLAVVGIDLISTEEELMDTSGQPYLCCSVVIAKNEAMGFYVYAIHLGLAQTVILARNPQGDPFDGVPTWAVMKLGTTFDVRHIREDARALVTRFIEARAAGETARPVFDVITND